MSFPCLPYLNQLVKISSVSYKKAAARIDKALLDGGCFREREGLAVERQECFSKRNF